MVRIMEEATPSGRRGIIGDILALASLVALAVIVFWPLFFPAIRIFATPDSALSDIIHFNYPVKHLVAQSLKLGRIPVLAPAMANGLPILAEGESGVFSIMTLLTLPFLPTPVAFNLLYILSFLVLSAGTYALARELQFSRPISLWSAIVVSTSGFVTVQLPHLSHMMTYAWMPVVLALWIRTLKDPNGQATLLLPLAVREILVAGHYQYAFMTATLVAGLTAMARIVPVPSLSGTRGLVRAIVLSAIGIGLAAMQLLPSAEYLAVSDRGGLFTHLQSAGMPPVHILRFALPRLFGEAATGSYDASSWGIASWESFGYVGFVAVSCIVAGAWVAFRNGGMPRLVLALFAGALVLAMESHTPLYVLFLLPPFSWFRMHARFLSVAIVTGSLLGAYGLSAVSRAIGKNVPLVSTLIPFIAIALSGIELTVFAHAYHPTIQSTELAAIPQVAATSSGSIASIGVTDTWRISMSENGWKHPEWYRYLSLGLIPNQPLIAGHATTSVYAGILPKHLELREHLVASGVTTAADTRSATISTTSAALLRMNGTGLIASAFNLTGTGLTEIASINAPTGSTLPDIKYYAVASPARHIYRPRLPVFAASPDDISQVLSTLGPDAVIHTDGTPASASAMIPLLTVVIDEPERMAMMVSQNEPGYIVTTQLRYPGWHATVDGARVPIIPANVTGMAVAVPTGTHAVELRYTPYALIIGTIVTGVSALVYAAVVIARSRNGVGGNSKQGQSMPNRIRDRSVRNSSRRRSMRGTS